MAMMEEVEDGGVEAIIVKDMSRLGRDYLKVGQGNQPKSFNYRGAELFNQWATLLYDDFDQSTAEAVLTTRSVEL